MKRRTSARMVLALGFLTAWLAGPGAGVAQQGYQFKISFAAYTNRSEVLTNFPALVVLNNGVGGSRFNFVSYPFAAANGFDLRFQDARGSNLNYEIESWNTNAACYVWVQVPTLTNNGTGFIWAKWGNPADAGQLPCTTNGSVWADGFRLVEHMAVSNGTTVADATASNRQATIVNEYAYTPSGVIGSALNLSRTTDRNNGLNLNTNLQIGSTWTIGCWFKGLQSSTDWRTLARGTANHHVIVQSGSDNLGSYIGNFYQAGTATLVPDTTWHSIAAVGSGSQTKMYVDGALRGTVAGQATDDLMAIGYYQGGSQRFANYLDEFHVDSYARSSNWVWACYMNQGSNSAFNGYSKLGYLDGRPTVDNLPPTNIAANVALLNGSLTLNGASPATVSVYWGPTDGSVNAGNWANTNTFAGGPWADGTLMATNLTTLGTDQDCFYAFAAANGSGTSVATPSIYLIDGALNLTATDAALGSSLTDTATVVVSRPATCTGGPLTVYYALGGTTTNGVNYAASPASGSLVIPAGQTNATITLTPLLPFNFGAPLSVPVTLLPGNYAMGAVNSATCTIQTVFSQPYTWSAASGNWSAAGNWTPAGGPPANGGDSGLIASGTATADTNLGSVLNFPALTVSTGGTLVVSTATLTNPLTFNGGVLNGTAGKTLAGNITLAAGGMTVTGTAAYTLSGALNGPGGLTLNGNTLTLGGGVADTNANTFTGTLTCNAGTLVPNKNSGVIAIPGNVVINGGSLPESGLYGQINNNASITIYNGSFSLTVPNTQPATSETVSNFYLLGPNTSASVGSGSYGGSSVTVLGNTIVSNATLGANGKGASWTTTGMTLWGLAGRTHLTTSTGDNNGGSGITIGTNGLTIYQPTSGAFTVASVSIGNASSRSSVLTLNGDLTFNGNAANTNSALIQDGGGQYTHNLTLGGTRTFTINPGGGPVDMAISLQIAGGGLTKVGNGTLVLISTNNTYSGPTTIRAGSLLVNGNLAAGTIVTNYATLGGTGLVSGAVTVLGGTLAPGYFAPGRLTFGNNLTLTNSGPTNAVCQIKIGGTTAGMGYDQVVLTSQSAKLVLTNTTLNVSLVNGFHPANGSMFTIIDNQGSNAVQGTFSGLPTKSTIPVGSTFFRISYVGGTGNDVVLTASNGGSVILVR